MYTKGHNKQTACDETSWHDPCSESGSLNFHHCIQVKGIWIPYKWQLCACSLAVAYVGSEWCMHSWYVCPHSATYWSPTDGTLMDGRGTSVTAHEVAAWQKQSGNIFVHAHFAQHRIFQSTILLFQALHICTGSIGKIQEQWTTDIKCTIIILKKLLLAV